DCAIQYFRFCITISRLGSSPLYFSRTTSAFPLSIFARAAPDFSSTSHVNPCVSASNFCHLNGYSCPIKSVPAAVCAAVTLGSKLTTAHESLPVLQSLPRSVAIQTFAPSSLVVL